MKILRAYIENFGKLSKREFDFLEGFNFFVEENGYGKTTFATFIKAMFYGMKSTTKKLLDENEKKKYFPWQGGNFGGFLEFQVGENKYKVERFFGKKDSEDTFSLIDLKTGKRSGDYTENLGEELFGLDEESYERCTFIPQKEIESGISDKLSSKLINMIQGTNNKDSFEQAINIVKEKSLELKKRGNTGKINEVETEINEIKEEIDSLKSGIESLDKFQEFIKEEDEIILNLNENKEKIEQKIKEYSKYQEAVANKKYIEDKLKVKNQLEKAIKENEEILNNKEVSESDLSDAINKNQELINVQAKVNSLKEESLNEKKYKELKLFFGENQVKEEDVLRVIEKEEKLKNINLNLENKIKNGAESFSKRKPFVVFGLMFLICLTLGFVSLNQKALSIVMFIIAGVLGVISLISYLKKYNSNSKKTAKVLSINDNELIKEKELIENEINLFVSLFKNCEVSNLTAFLYDLKSKVKEYNTLETEINKKQEIIEQLTEVIGQLNKENNLFFDGFNLDESLSFNDKILKLKNAITGLESSKKDLDRVNSQLQEFKTVDLNDFELENIDISVLQDEQKQLQQNIDIHRDRKSEYIRKIDKAKNIVEDLEELEVRLEEKILIRNNLKKEYQTLSNVSKFLIVANDNLTAKYKKPMQDNLNKYLKEVLGDKYQQFNIDTDLKVSFEEYGQEREVDYLSKGFKGVVNLCVRFALINTLFEKEKPFVILDDPFVNFDKEKIKNSLNVIKLLSKEYQIIYFACHESRI